MVGGGGFGPPSYIVKKGPASEVNLNGAQCIYLAARCLYARTNISGFLKSWGELATHAVSLATAVR